MTTTVECLTMSAPPDPPDPIPLSYEAEPDPIPPWLAALRVVLLVAAGMTIAAVMVGLYVAWRMLSQWD